MQLSDTLSLAENTMSEMSRSVFATRRCLTLLLLLAPSVAAALDRPVSTQPARTAGDVSDAALLRFSILDDSGRPISGRLTFLGAGGPDANLFPNADADPNDLAVRRNIIYSVRGTGLVSVPPGKYTLFASRGLEWSIAQTDVELMPGQTRDVTLRLRHELQTQGWISGDFHLHTLTYSGHGDSNMKERIITFVGEGLEFAVATDHNHNTDYEPTMRELGLAHALTSVTGNEVSTPVGHFNAFPLDPNRPIPPPMLRDAGRLFALIRKETNRYGVTPIIQLNHPRWGNIDYFGRAGLDPITGVSALATYSEDFDTIEIFNENEGWGYYDADLVHNFSTGESKHSVLRDWFNLLNRGHRYAAVGNSDSHNVHTDLAAYPRNFVRSSTDDPGRISVTEVAQRLRNNEVFTTMGPFVEFRVGDAAMGGQTRAAADGTVELNVRVQAASWVDCDRVRIVVNGDIVHELPVPDTRSVLRLDARHTLRLARDSWVTLLVEGDDPMDPIVHTQTRPIRPLAVLNPIWVDADGDGKWTSPWDQALAAVELASAQPLTAALQDRLPTERGLLMLAAAQQKHSQHMELLRSGMADPQRPTRLLAAAAAAQLADPSLAPLFEKLVRGEAGGSDMYLRMLALQALHRVDPQRTRPLVLELLDSADKSLLAQHGATLAPMLPGTPVTEWLVCGYFPKASTDALLTSRFGPEETPFMADQTFTGKNDAQIGWKTMRTAQSGMLNLQEVLFLKPAYEQAITYARVFVYSGGERPVRFSTGSDDGCRLWLNGELIYEDASEKGVNPLQHVGTMKLRNGWNEVLAKVENGGGPYGLYLRLFADDLRFSVRPE